MTTAKYCDGCEKRITGPYLSGSLNLAQSEEHTIASRAFDACSKSCVKKIYDETIERLNKAFVKGM